MTPLSGPSTRTRREVHPHQIHVRRRTKVDGLEDGRRLLDHQLGSTAGGSVDPKEVRSAEALGARRLVPLAELVAVGDGVLDVHHRRLGQAVVERRRSNARVLHFAREHAALHRR